MDLPNYTQSEERAHTLTHLFGFIISIMAVGLLVQSAFVYNDQVIVFAFVLYGLSLICCFLSSTLYHYVEKPALKFKLRVIDHLAIYFLIGGSYTPFALINLRDNGGMRIFFIIWALALGGMLFKILIRNQLQKYEKADAFFYLALGLVAFLFLDKIQTSIAPEALRLLSIGGAFYIVGVLFYLWKAIPYNHAIWHLFVIAGAGFHFMAIWYYAVPT